MTKTKKFHVGKNGPGQCNAEKRACRYGGESHYDTMAAAEAAFAQEDGLEITETITKSSKKSAAPVIDVRNDKGEIQPREGEVFPYVLNTRSEHDVAAHRATRDATVKLSDIQFGITSDMAYQVWEKHEGMLEASVKRGNKRMWVKEAKILMKDFETVREDLPALPASYQKKIWEGRKEIMDVEYDLSSDRTPVTSDERSSATELDAVSYRAPNETMAEEQKVIAKFSDPVFDNMDAAVKEINSPVLTATYNDGRKRIAGYFNKGDRDTFMRESRYLLDRVESYDSYEKVNPTAREALDKARAGYKAYLSAS